MMRRFVQLTVIMTFLWAGAHLKAQPSKTYPSEPAEFISKFVSGLEKSGTKEIQQYAKVFEEKWITGFMTQSEQERFISQVNIMLLKNYNPGTELLPYAKAIDAIKKEESFGKLDLQEFFIATDSCILLLERPKTLKFYQFIETFCTSGAAFKTSNASWSYSQPDPKLSFKTYSDPETGRSVSFPFFTFANTSIIYKNKRDSTHIHSTKGQLNLMNKVWDGDGGIIDWSKMKLDPSDVYAELGEYGLNLNYSFVKIDTVLFHYNSLIGKPLKGKYEDMNRGYSDINKANYPSFRSYEGGVVIENFIPNVRYEGGFSLRGIRKIGSAYYEWVDIETPEIPEEEDPVLEDEEESDPNGSVEDEWEDAYDYDDSAFYFEEDEEVLEDDWDETEAEEYTDEGDEYDEADMEEDYPEELGFLDREYKLVKAKLDVFHNGERKMTLRALEFVLDLEKLVSRRTEVALHISEEDSITHPSVDVVYEVDSSKVTLMKDVKDRLAHQAFLSPYHGYYLYFDAIVWDQKTDQINFTSLIDKENQNSAIESYDFFKLQRMRQFKGVLSFNPIGAIWRYMNLHPGEVITAEDICAEYKKDQELPALLLALPDVEGSGFIKYDRKTHVIKPLDKLEYWARAARGKKDYDAISILSRVSTGNNSELNLNNNNIDIFGVKYFALSDSQFVRSIPNQMHVKVMANRDLNYDGRMAAGKLNFFGRVSPDSAKIDTSMGKFTFQYDNYKILCDSLDSLKFDFERDKRLGVGGSMSKLQKALQNTTIEGVTGAIYINKPNNKAGLEPHPEYPVFDSYTKSYVYWANPNVRDGVYTKDKFFFAIDPFVLDSLESFDERSLSFEGEFKSSDIFPPIKQKLTVMEDYTLGLIESTPSDTGYAAYEGKGRFKGDIQLDGSGLSSDGSMEFNSTTAVSDSFQMYFDSVKAITNEFTLPKGQRENGAIFPQIDAKTVQYKWLTQKDQIELETTEAGEPIVLFDGEGTFEGKLIVTEFGLKGSGTLTLGNVSIESEEIDFNETDFKAKGGTFTVYDKNNPGKELYVATDMEIDYNVKTHHSEFQSKEVGIASSAFPEQQFKTSLGKGVYDKDKNDLVLSSLSPKKGSNFFYSSDPKQDSLAFLAETAHYNFDEKEIEIEGVPYIYVADAKITPDTGEVTVKPDGYLQKLEDALIEANLETKFHRIYDGDVEIQSSKYYEGSGKYDYIAIGGKDQFINMSEIKVQADTLTIAKGTIPEEQEFYLTDRILFKGQTFLEANQKYMRFAGEVKIENEAIGKNWLSFDTIVNPDSVFIPIKPEMLGKLVVGLHYIERNRVFYSTFLQTKKEPKDIDVAIAAGGLTFDRNTNEFRIGPAKKLTGVEYRGTTSSLDDVNNVVTTVGKLDFPFQFNKNTISGEVAGKWRDDLNNQEISSELMFKFNFSCIPKEAWEKIGDRFRLVTAANDDIDFTNSLFIQSLAEFLDPNYRQPEKNITEFQKKVGEAEVPSEDVKVFKDLGGDIFISGVRFKYDQDYKSLYYAGDVGLVGMGEKSINKVLGTNSRIEYNIGKYTPAGLRLSDTLRMYLEVDEFNWVYYEFHGDVMYTWSTDLDGYNAELASAIEKRKKNDGYRFELVSDYEVQEFISRFVNRYVWKD